VTVQLSLVVERVSLLDRTQELVHEFAGQVPAGKVIACVLRCRDALERAGLRSGLAIATEAMARARLSADRHADLRTFGPVARDAAVVD
jgi:hypothetical protein